MSGIVFASVLLAALMHASWNALIRRTFDRFASMLLLALSQGGLALLFLPFVPIPSAAAWPYIGVAALLHTGYKLFLIRAYAHGDLSQVYPLARGSAPLLVVLAGAVFFDEHLGLAGFLSVLAIGLGVIMMAGSGGLAKPFGRGTAYALGTAAFTAAYTLADAAGARISGHAFGFAVWMFVIDAMAMACVALAARGPAVYRGLASSLRTGLAAGALSLGSYGIVIWAFTQAPVALVAALRETSVLFALLIAALFLGERVPARRWAAALVITAGIAATRL